MSRGTRNALTCAASACPGCYACVSWAAPEGTVWVCGACGKYGKDRLGVGDESCAMWGTLCYEDSLIFGPDGKVIGAKAVKPPPGT